MNYSFTEGDGRLGYPKLAPYDAIHVGAAAPTVPQPVSEQSLACGYNYHHNAKTSFTPHYFFNFNCQCQQIDTKLRSKVAMDLLVILTR